MQKLSKEPRKIYSLSQQSNEILDQRKSNQPKKREEATSPGVINIRFNGQSFQFPKTLKNRFSIIKCQDQGGFGAVYDCFDQQTKSMCVIKIVSTTTFSQFQMPNRSIKAFEEEAIVLMKLKAKGVSQIVTSGTTACGHHFIILEKYGPNLSKMLD